MKFRELHNENQTKNFNELIDELREELLREKLNIEIAHRIFEELFGEKIGGGLMRVFEKRFNALTHSKKESFIEEVVNRYDGYGEFGFATIVLQPLSRI